jgi:hypothetical protein
MTSKALTRGLSATLLFALPAAAQIESPGRPASLLGGLEPSGVPLEFVQPPDVEAYRADDELRGNWPLRYGALLEVDVTPETHGVWDELGDGTRVWRIEFYSPDAKSIGLELDDFWLSPGSALYLYDASYERVAGAFTDVNNQPHDQIQLAPFRGDRVFLEYVQPADSEPSRISVGTVIYDYRDVFEMERQLDTFAGGDTAEGSCLIDVNCPEADPYPLSKRAVVRTLSGGGLCSGALINNSASDGTQYIYTAWHCGQTSNTVFRFNYQTSGCGSGSAPTNQQVSGCTVLTSNQSSDGRLLRINNLIPASYNPYFAGWSRSTTNTTRAYGMHHPSGGPKKFSYDGNGAFKQNANFQGIGTVTCWRADFNYGGVQGGSSGSPMFDQNDRIRGALTGGPGGSCPLTSYYGRLDQFWNNAGIATYLDPTGSGATTVDGYDPSNPGGGGGGGNPQINSTTPTVLPTVSPEAPVIVSLEGSGFLGVTDVTFNGTSLGGFPPQFTIVDDSKINLQLIGPFGIGTAVVEVIEGSQADTYNLPIAPPIVPTVDLANSDPGFLIQALGLQISMGSLPGDLHFLFASPSNVGSTLPGYFTLGLGNNLTSLVYLGAYTVDPSLGYAQLTAPVSGLPTGTKIYVQSAVFQATNPVLPLVPSNVESGTVLF